LPVIQAPHHALFPRSCFFEGITEANNDIRHIGVNFYATLLPFLSRTFSANLP
jgi:hypothetical protein